MLARQEKLAKGKESHCGSCLIQNRMLLQLLLHTGRILLHAVDGLGSAYQMHVQCLQVSRVSVK